MEITDMNWRKSSYSGGNGGSCIEVASDGAVMVRDTKQNGTGPTLQFSPDAWRRFSKQVKKILASRQKRAQPACGRLGSLVLRLYRQNALSVI